MRFITTVYSDSMDSLPRCDPRAKADFIAQHLKHRWSEPNTTFRYQLWSNSRIEENPKLDIPKRRYNSWRGSSITIIYLAHAVQSLSGH